MYKIVLKTSHKHTERVDNCVETWLSALDYVCLTDKLTGKYPEISGSDKDDYQSNEEKTVTFINLVRTTDQFDKYDWLVFIDDDAILNIPLFETFLPTMDKSMVYGYSMKGSYTKNPEIDYPSGGCGYFISPQLIKTCEPMSVHGTGYEDVSMGIWLRDNNISINSTIKLNGWFPFQRYFNDLWTKGDSYVEEMISEFKEKDVTFLHKHVTHHYIRHKSFMKYLHTLLNEKSPLK